MYIRKAVPHGEQKQIQIHSLFSVCKMCTCVEILPVCTNTGESVICQKFEKQQIPPLQSVIATDSDTSHQIQAKGKRIGIVTMKQDLFDEITYMLSL